MSQAKYYPGADRTTQWRGTGGATMLSVDKLLLHTTESAGWPAYPRFEPTLTFNPWLARGKRWRQHLPINGSASTLANAAAYRTNRANVCQIEIVAYCDPTRKTSSAWIGNISDDAYRELGEFLAWINREWEVPLKLYPKWKPYPSSYGISNGIRMSAAQFDAFMGVCGHQHAPGNTHGDPGALDVQAVLKAALEIEIGGGGGVPDVVETKVRTLSINVRNKTAITDIPFPSRHWSKRLPQLVRLIKDIVKPSVVGVQECRNDMAVDITNGVSPNWTFWGAGTSKILWDTTKWKAIDQWEGGLPYKKLGKTKQRPITMVRLISAATGGSCWFVSTHLAVNIANEESIRVAQSREAIRLISQRSVADRVVILADLNDVLTTSGVRKVFAAAGYNHLRARLSDEVMTGDSRNTFNGWKLTKREGKWIDDVLTSRDVKPYIGTVFLTDTSAFPVHASDHNGCGHRSVS